MLLLLPLLYLASQLGAQLLKCNSSLLKSPFSLSPSTHLCLTPLSPDLYGGGARNSFLCLFPIVATKKAVFRSAQSFILGEERKKKPWRMVLFTKSKRKVSPELVGENACSLPTPGVLSWWVNPNMMPHVGLNNFLVLSPNPHWYNFIASPQRRHYTCLVMKMLRLTQVIKHWAK